MMTTLERQLQASLEISRRPPPEVLARLRDAARQADDDLHDAEYARPLDYLRVTGARAAVMTAYRVLARALLGGEP